LNLLPGLLRFNLPDERFDLFQFFGGGLSAAQRT